MHKTRMAVLVAISVIALAGCNKQQPTGGNEAAGNAAATSAASIDGTWKADLSTVKFDQKPDEFLLKDGKYDCKTCTPPFSVAADGASHPVTGQPYFDSLSVKVVDDKTVQASRKKGNRDVGGATMKVSDDGKSLAIDWKDATIENAPPTTGHTEETRVAAGPAGAHAVSGQWKPTKVENINAEALTTTYKLEGDTLHMSSPSGTSYDAKLDGSDTPIKGDPAGTTASLKKLADNSFEETDRRNGKVVAVATFSVGVDGKMKIVYENKEDGSKVTYIATKS